MMQDNPDGKEKTKARKGRKVPYADCLIVAYFRSVKKSTIDSIGGEPALFVNDLENVFQR
jgi:hypothetical protein